MRVVNVSSLKGDEILGRQVFDDCGRVLLNVGVKLNHFYIRRLMSLDIQSVYIDDEISKEVEINESISEKTRQISKYAIKEVMEKYSREGKTDNNGIMKSVNSILDEVISNKSVLVNVLEIRSSDKNIFSHSVNVSVLASLLGIHMGYNMLKLKDISVGALLHDIGKTKIMNDKKIMAGFKSKFESDKYIELMHPKAGYDFLTNENFCNAYSKVAVLMHHENVDGSGYPLKLKGDEINQIAKLVSVCDFFDNIISGKEGQPPKPVYEALEYVVGMSGHSFDQNIVKAFTMNIAAFPSGTGVVLNTKEKCLVVRQNMSMPSRPVVKVLFYSNGNAVEQPYEIDLMKELSVFITGNCDLNI